LTAALPTSNSDSNSVARRQSSPTTSWVYMCTNVNYTGTCLNSTVPLGYSTCVELNNTSWLYNISSFQPAPNAACYLNHGTNCTDLCMDPEGCDEIVEYPGYANLSTYGYPPWTDYVGSFSCELSSS